MIKTRKVLFKVAAPIIFALAVGLIYLLFPKTHPMGGINLKVSKDEIINRSEEIIEPWKIKVDSFRINVESKQNKELSRAVYKHHGMEEGNRILREKIPAFFQEVTFSNHEKNIISELGLIEHIKFNFSGTGDLLYFNLEISDSVELASVSFEDARSTAEQFLSIYYKNSLGDVVFDQSRKIERLARTDYQFTWSGEQNDPQLDLSIEIKIIGDKVYFFEQKLQPPVPFESDTTEIIRTILELIFIIFFVIFTLIIAFKHTRNYEINFRYALYIAIILSLFFLMEMGLSQQGTGFWEMMIILPVSVIFLGIVLFISWAVGESVTREVWNEKFFELDLYAHGYILNSRQGYAVLRGIFYGITTFAILSILFWIMQTFVKFEAALEGDYLDYLSTDGPFFNLTGSVMRKSLFLFSSVFLLITSLLYKKTSKIYLSAMAGALPLAIFLRGGISPLYIALPLEWLALILPVWVFIRYNGLTGLTSLVTFVFCEFGLIFFYSDVLPFNFFVAFFVLLSVYALLAILTPDMKVDIDNLSPDLVAYINERKRLKHELEVAREVQMSFLPQDNPEVFGLDIASDCQPASEVGGDYYDFISLGKDGLGIALGDVSGKGTHAAFYMTLTKGFLRALTRTILSPAHILNEMNQLFYENSRKNAFISMIYAVFNLTSKEVTLARSGHDPVIHYRSVNGEIVLVDAKGIALGLDKGEIFGKIIQEVAIPLMKDDIFIIYTDGFTEAMNKRQEEYGQERLLNTVAKNAGGTAEDLMYSIFEDVAHFRGRAKQHDDMTIVIVKVK